MIERLSRTRIERSNLIAILPRSDSYIPMRIGLNTEAASLLLLLLASGSLLAGDGPNQLTPDESGVGWKLLFDGKTTAGWRSFKKQTFPAKGWVVEDGWLA